MAERGNRYIPSLPFLLRDAQPTYWELEGEPDARRRKENERRRDVARDELLRRYVEAEAASQLDELPRSIRELVEDWRRENGGELPRRKGGAPADPHWRMSIHLAAKQAVDSGVHEGRGAIASLEALADEACLSYESVRGVYYDKDPEWRRAVKAEIARRECEASQGFPNEPVNLRPTRPFDANGNND